VKEAKNAITSVCCRIGLPNYLKKVANKNGTLLYLSLLLAADIDGT
jgi:hypothetical protein